MFFLSSGITMPFCELWGCFVIDKTRKVKFLYNIIRFPLWRKTTIQLEYTETHKKKGASQTYDTSSFCFLRLSVPESTYKKCLREEWGKFTGYQLLSSFWLKVTRTDEDGNMTRWDRGTLPIRNLYPKWGMLRFGRMRKVTNWIWTLWFIVSYWWVT